MNKKILKEIKIIENFLLLESLADLFKDAPAFAKLFKGEAKALESIKGLFKNTKYLKPKESGAFAKFLRLSKEGELTAEQLIQLKNAGVDIASLRKQSADRIEGLLRVAKADRELTAVEKNMLSGHIAEMEKATKEIEAIKGGKKPAPTVEPKKTTPTAEPTRPVTPEPASTDPLVTAATDGLGLTKQQRDGIKFYQEQADRFRKAGDLERAAAADAKAAEIMGPEFIKQTGTTAKNAEEVASEVLKKRKLLDDLKEKGLGDSPLAKDLEKDIKALTGEEGMLEKAWRLCKGSPWICAGLTALLGYAAYRGGQTLIGGGGGGDSPTPGPNGGGGGGGKGGICHGGRTPKECSDISWGCGGHSGPTGNRVRVIQQKLIDCGFRLPKYGVDGLFCTETQGATKNFQKSKGLNPNGVVDSATMDALNKCNQKDEVTEPVEDSPTPAPQEPMVAQFSESLQRKRYNNLEKLVFERLVKGCK